MLPLAFMDIGFGELVVVGFVALVLFGGRLPEVMRTLGRTYRSFRRGVEGLTQDTRRVFDASAPAPYRPSPPPSSAIVPPAPSATASAGSPVPERPVASPPTSPASDSVTSSFDDAPPV